MISHSTVFLSRLIGAIGKHSNYFLASPRDTIFVVHKGYFHYFISKTSFQNGYDAGARFDGIAQQVLPPAPPGVPPSAAQLAAMAGHQVALGQKKNTFLAGGSEGGYTFW